MTTVNPQEIHNFENMANEWWDVNGKLKPLHKMNPTRIQYVTDQIKSHFKCDDLQNLSIIDVGCGGGLICEPLANMGAQVTGIDAGEIAIDIAKDHAEQNGLDITYINETSTNHAEQYDVVLALEIIEHVDNVDEFIASLKKLLKPNGLLILSTLNRTAKSFALGIVAAEYILRWLPQGTHNWKKFIKPSEMAKYIEDESMQVQDITGITYNPLLDHFSLSNSDIGVNYLLCATHQK